MEKQIAALNSASSKAEVKLLLLRQYMDLFSLYKQKDVFARNVEESTRRLEDIRRLKKEGIVTRNDELRSELQLTNDQLACREADDNIAIVSQQLDVLLGLDETFLLQPDTALLYTAVSLESYDAYVQQAYLNYPELQIARYNTKPGRKRYIPVKSRLSAFTLGTCRQYPGTPAKHYDGRRLLQQLEYRFKPLLQPVIPLSE